VAIKPESGSPIRALSSTGGWQEERAGSAARLAPQLIRQLFSQIAPSLILAGLGASKASIRMDRLAEQWEGDAHVALPLGTHQSEQRTIGSNRLRFEGGNHILASSTACCLTPMTKSRRWGAAPAMDRWASRNSVSAVAGNFSPVVGTEFLSPTSGVQFCVPGLSTAGAVEPHALMASAAPVLHLTRGT
jgi:hypothetical protein